MKASSPDLSAMPLPPAGLINSSCSPVTAVASSAPPTVAVSSPTFLEQVRARRVLLHTHIFEQVGSRVHGVLHHHFHRWKKSPSQASYNKHQKQISHHNSPEDGIDRNKPNAVNPMNTMRSAYALFITTTITAVVPSTAWVPMHMILGTGPSHLQGGGQHWLPVGLQHHGHQGEDSGIQQDSQCLHQPYWWDISLSQASGRLNLKIRSKFDFLEDNVASKRPIPSPTEPLPTTTCFTVSLTSGSSPSPSASCSAWPGSPTRICCFGFYLLGYAA